MNFKTDVCHDFWTTMNFKTYVSHDVWPTASRQGRMDRTGIFGQRTFPLLSPFDFDGLEHYFVGRCDLLGAWPETELLTTFYVGKCWPNEHVFRDVSMS